MNPYGIVIHGGAGTVSRIKMTKWKTEAYKQALKRAYEVGFKTLQNGGSALNAVKEAIVLLEDCPLFNAGKGSVFTNHGNNEMDAAIMDGKRMRAGAVAAVSFVKNPILLAETVMKKSKHVLISGEQALEYAKEQGLQIADSDYFYDEFRHKQWQRALAKDKTELDHDEEVSNKIGTVGAVALDKKGNLAAGTSTGGMVNKKYGRIGDSPLIGMGTYANNHSCAISCTGHGEFFIRSVVAYDINARMIYNEETLEEAAHHIILEHLKGLGGRGGLVGIDKFGNMVMPFNTKGMYRGFKHSNGDEFVGIFGDE